MLSVTHPASSRRLTPYQQQVSTKIKQTLPDIPDVVSELIGTYVFDYSLAGQTLIFSGTGEVLNPDVRAMIKLALISDACEVSIKQLIFDNMRRYQTKQAMQRDPIEDIDKAPKRDFYKSALSLLCLEINEEGSRINLDDVSVEAVSLSGCLDHMTAKRAVFKWVKFSHVQIKYADLTGATLDQAHFYVVNLQSAIAVDLSCKNTVFQHTEVTNMLTNDPALLRSGCWRHPRGFALDCVVSTTNRDKINAFRLPDRPATTQQKCLIM